jgi:hypothetical protein
MLDKLLSAAATNAKLAIAAVAGAALVASGGAVAISNVADSSPASEHASEQGRAASLLNNGNRSDTATATISPKPSKSPKVKNEGEQGVHGACVSAVARDKNAVIDGSHGKAVSAAAKNCPKGSDEAKASKSPNPEKSAKSAKPAKSPKPANASDADDSDEAGDESGEHGPSSTGQEHREGHGPF